MGTSEILGDLLWNDPDTMCRTQKYQGDLVSTKRLINFGINLLNCKGLKKVI